jgi:hypothetical protein
MKTVRLLTFVVIAVLVFSAWTPSLAYAKASVPGTTSIILAAKGTTGTLKIDNRTGGTIYIRLTEGPKAYYFVASKQGMNTFTGIMPGKYVATHNTSACKGSSTKRVKFTAGGTVSLGRWHC